MRAIREAGENVSGKERFLEPLFAAHRDPLKAEQWGEDLEVHLSAKQLRSEFLVLGLRFEAKPEKFGGLNNG